MRTRAGLRLRSIAAATGTAVLLTVGAGIATLATTAPAAAACFEDIGCTDSQYFATPLLFTLSCDSLWTARNFMYDEHGYCFQTARAQAVFSNEGCFVTDGASIAFNAFEVENIDRIRAVEREKGC
jgi:hypothetical protein